ncbi:hypothetical protein [Paenibacillus ehimensis]|uniref:Uncharacterized protein n=1 Tax=Paenibacillus ehimensis TaxID=79264 RepID=A0ABT8V6A5_9BACL|nr:hypothetical protein [Paenibacillus ehimensis]MDO3676039.1 hypothetical protein [Paenibacillus ehimensis]MEC0213337.1 hypothetical protein [Paenibacillus ehimensis]
MANSNHSLGSDQSVKNFIKNSGNSFVKVKVETEAISKALAEALQKQRQQQQQNKFNC